MIFDLGVMGGFILLVGMPEEDRMGDFFPKHRMRMQSSHL